MDHLADPLAGSLWLTLDVDHYFMGFGDFFIPFPHLGKFGNNGRGEGESLWKYV